MLYVVQLVGDDMGAESRVISIKVTQLNDKLFSRVNIAIFLILRYFLYLRDVPNLYIYVLTILPSELGLTISGDVLIINTTSHKR